MIRTVGRMAAGAALITIAGLGIAATFTHHRPPVAVTRADSSTACAAIAKVDADLLPGHTASTAQTDSDITAMQTAVTAYGVPLTPMLAQVQSAARAGQQLTILSDIGQMGDACATLGH